MGRAILATIGAVTLALVGCGADEDSSEPKDPRLPAELAAALAVESDRIAESLAAGSDCAAHRQAQALRAHVGDAVGSGDVPPALGREMSAAATALNEGIDCEPAPKAPPKPTVTGCEQVIAQLTQLEAQIEQAKDQEHEAHGGDKQLAKDLREQYEDQAKALEDQLKDQCGEEQQDGEFVPPGHGGDNPGRGNGGD